MKQMKKCKQLDEKKEKEIQDGSQAAKKKRFAYSARAAVLSPLDDIFFLLKRENGTESHRQKLLQLQALLPPDFLASIWM